MEPLRNLDDLLRFLPPCLVAFCLFRWFLRERRAGPLLLEASRKAPYRSWGLVFWIAVLASSLLLNSRLNFIWWNALSIMVYRFVLAWRLEFRQFGIVTGSWFYPWRRIQSYDWGRGEQTEGEQTEEALLQLSLRNRPTIFSVQKLPVQQERRAEAERIMRQFVPVDR